MEKELKMALTLVGGAITITLLIVMCVCFGQLIERNRSHGYIKLELERDRVDLIEDIINEKHENPFNAEAYLKSQKEWIKTGIY